MHIIPINSAISPQEGEFYFASSEASFANGGMSDSPESRNGKFLHTEKIKGVNLYQYLKKNYADSLDKLAFLKVDTEGYDKEIIKSVADLIQEYKPVIVAESFGDNTDEEKMELFEVISKHGYDIFHFEDFDVNAPIEKVNEASEMIKWKGTVDIYALPRK